MVMNEKFTIRTKNRKVKDSSLKISSTVARFDGDDTSLRVEVIKILSGPLSDNNNKPFTVFEIAIGERTCKKIFRRFCGFKSSSNLYRDWNNAKAFLCKQSGLSNYHCELLMTAVENS
jgi:hypothetical protein